jgi:hypothetical protein
VAKAAPRTELTVVTRLQDGLDVLALLVRRQLRLPQRPAATPALPADRILPVDPRAESDAGVELGVNVRVKVTSSCGFP